MATRPNGRGFNVEVVVVLTPAQQAATSMPRLIASIETERGWVEQSQRTDGSGNLIVTFWRADGVGGTP